MNKSGDTLFRQWVMLQQIPTEPHKASTTQIRDKLAAEGYETTARTVQRDLDQLSVTFGYTSELQGRTNLWFWPKHTQPIDIPSMPPSTAAAFAMLGDQMSGQLPAGTLMAVKPYIDRAKDVLSMASNNPYSRWREKVRTIGRGPLLAKPNIAFDVFDAVCNGLLQDLCIEALYRPRGAAQGSKQLLHPLGLVIREDVYYLVATAREYTNVLQYALHRMSNANLTESPAQRPAGFDLHEYITKTEAFSYPVSDRKIRLQADFHRDVAEHLEERPLAADQITKDLQDGRVRVEATVADTQELRWWLLGFWKFVTVRKPVTLRREMVEMLREASANYPD